MSNFSNRQETATRSNPVESFTGVTDSLNWFSSLVEYSSDAFISANDEGSIIGWNKAAEQLLGFSKAEMINSPIQEIFSRNNKDVAGSLLKQSAVCEKLLFIQTKTGTEIAVSVTISPLPGGSVSPAVSLLIRDISPEKIETKKLERSYRNLRAIFENAQEGFVLIDCDGNIREFNNVARGSILLSHSARNLEQGHSIFEHIDQTRREFFRGMMDRVISGETIQYDKYYEASDSKSFWFSISLNAVREGDKVTGISITGIDITTRKQAEEGVETKEKFYRTIVENSADAVTIFSEEAKQLFVSPSIKNILGYSEEESLDISIFSLIHPEDVEGAADIWAATFAHPGETIKGHIIRILHKDGSYRWMENTVTNLIHDPIIKGIVSNFKDITEKIEADRQIRESQERYRYLFYNNPLPMWIFDPETYRFLEINNAAIAKYGYTREEFLTMTIKDIRPDDEIERLIASMHGRFDTDYNNSGTWEHVTKSKEVLDVEISSHPVDFENRTAILVLANDVTEKKKATRLLLKVYQENSNILESIRDGFLTVNKEWKVTYFNNQAEKILQMPRTEILGRNLWEVYSEAIPLKFYSEAHRAVDENIAITFEEYFPPLNLWADVSVYPSDDGLSAFFKDITEKKQTEEKIMIAKERYEIVSRATNQAVYEWDVENNVTYWNEGFETIFGHQRIEGEMSSLTWLDNLHPDEKDEVLKKTDEAMKNKITSFRREFRFRCANGDYKFISDNSAIIYNEGKPIKLVGAMHDITEKKKHEDRVNELNEQLNKRAQELAISNKELERFAYVASHDLQEPLRMVSSFLQLLQKKYEPQLDESAKQYIAFAVDGADRMKRLILDLLEYSRVGTNKDILVDTDMNEVLEQIQRNYITRIAEREAVITVKNLPTIKGNRTQLTQLVQNLISNALKYNTSFVPEVEVGCEEKADVWQFYVKDNGIGVDQKFFDKIFIIFQRLHNRNQFSGTGIGLAICKKIVDRHNGEIWLESTPGVGSTFYFSIKK